MITIEEIEAWKQEKELRQFSSNLGFLLAHNGWRRGNIHSILGVSSGGKSTLVRTLMIDAVGDTRKPKRVGIVLSEEKEVDFLVDMNTAKIVDFSHFAIFGELEKKFNSVRDYFAQLAEFVEDEKIDILFYDNLTTSFAYMDRPAKEQSDVAKIIKNFAISKDIPVVVVLHSGAEVSENYERMIEMNHVRGSKSIVNLSEFFYVMQSFYCGDKRTNTLRICKNRGYTVANRLYSLYYYPSYRIFGKDELLSFGAFQDVFKKRNRL